MDEFLVTLLWLQGGPVLQTQPVTSIRQCIALAEASVQMLQVQAEANWQEGTTPCSLHSVPGRILGPSRPASPGARWCASRACRRDANLDGEPLRANTFTFHLFVQALRLVLPAHFPLLTTGAKP